MKKITILYFTAPWCGPCRVFGPIVEKLAEANETVDVEKISVDDNPVMASQYNVLSVPQLVLLGEPDGEEVGRIIGYKPQAKVQAELDKHLGV